MFSKLTLLLTVFFLIVRDTGSEYVQTQILEARQLYPFRAYKDVQLFHYTVPPQVSLASFQYKANGSFHCSPKPVAVYLQYGSYPVINPRDTSFPESFVIKRLFLHNITLQTDFVAVMLNVSNPMPGNWYAAAFLLENTDRIAQKGLFTPCSGWLTTFVKLNINSNVITLLSDSNDSHDLDGNKLFRFFANNNSWSCEVKLKKCETDEDDKCPVIVKIRQRAIPSSDSDDDLISLNCSSVDDCAVKFVPAVSDWNYILVQSLVPTKFELSVYAEACENVVFFNPSNDSMDLELLNDTYVDGNSTEMNYFGMVLQKIYSNLNEMTCGPNIQLVRISLSTNLAFEYNLPSEYEDAYPLILNITNYGPTFTSFEVLPTVDIGGTLVLELAISPFMNLSHSNVSVMGCLAYGIRPGALQDFRCESGISLMVNTSVSGNRLATVMVPFPEAGIWYFGLIPRCYINNSNETNTIPCEMSTTSVFLRIRSSPCMLGQCGEFGTCYQYVSGGFIFSTCNCIAGWRGWGCTDGSSAHSNAELLLDVLLLTLSNLLFIPAIILGIYRSYFTEAFVYFTTMVFSAFYHACDAEVFSYCLMRLSVLQFCDFYSAILSIWVTLIAMADLPTALQSFTHMAGAIGVALGVEYDRTGLWVIVVPAGIGFLILVTSWVTRCYQNHVCYPKKTIWLYCLLPGIVLALCGLIIYAFFETKDNYPYVHSAWHITIALSVLFLLPKRKVKNEGTPEPLGSSSYIRVADIANNLTPNPNSSAYEHLLTPTP